ncbi:pilus assembly protein PilX, partial [Salmonella enterica]|nr:pilus assembly protein PilX [Salmonella enterica]
MRFSSMKNETEGKTMKEVSVLNAYNRPDQGMS